MVKKVYISLGANPLSVDVLVEGRLRSADFTGGLKNPTVLLMPKYMTEDEKLQKELEAHPGYGTFFTLHSEEVTVEPEKENSVDGFPDKESEVPTSFSTVKEAKNWFNNFKGIPYGKMSTKEKLLSVASGFGVNLVFDNE